MFNDSNTSEFDDANCDSRQETSLDYSTSNRMLSAAANSTSDDPRHARGPNDQVMDADLRQASRINLEFALLQNAAQNFIMSPSQQQQQQQQQTDNTWIGTKNSFARASRSRSLSSAHAAHIPAHLGAPSFIHQHQQFPQSGCLWPVSSELGGGGGQSVAAISDSPNLGHQRRQRSKVVVSSPLPESQAANRQRQLSFNCELDGDDDSGCCATNSNNQSSSSAGDLHDHLQGLSSRRSSCLSGHSTCSNWSNQQQQQQAWWWPSLRVSVRRLEADKQTSTSSDGQSVAAAAKDRRSLFSSLASTIGRSRSSDSPSEAPPALYEIRLVEARNLSRGRQQQQQVASEAPQPSPRRRDSLLGALVAAATGASGPDGGPNAGSAGNSSPSALRRNSVEGIYARVFKQQIQQTTTDECASLGSQAGLANQAAAQQTNSADQYVQLPLIKLAPNNQSSELVNFDQAAPFEGAYRFVCRQDEFPVRLSLYQVAGGKRGGARYTLGHCVLSEDDWAELLAGEQPTEQVATTTSSSTMASGRAFQSTIREVNESSSSENENDDQQQHFASPGGQPAVGREIHLEYQLFQTILEAIKSTSS